MFGERKIGVDIVGFGPIGRDLARKLIAPEGKFYVASVSDSSTTIFPVDSSQVLESIRQKERSKEFKLSGLKDFKRGPEGESLEGVQTSGASVAVDVTNSDYRKAQEARRRAEAAIDSGKHFVSANKVAFANYFSQILEHARKRQLSIGFGATVCGARHAIRVARSLDPGEVQSASGVLNTSTTLILSKLEENPALSFDDACNEAEKSGILESDRSIDLDGVDAAAKTSILSNALFPSRQISISDVARSGIREKEIVEIIESQRRESQKHRIRLVSEINGYTASVNPRPLPLDSPLAVSGRFNVVSLSTTNLGEISIKSFGGGVSLTSSVLLSDMKEVVSVVR